MKAMFKRTKQGHMTTMEKLKDVLHQRDDLKLQMEAAFTAKEAVSPEAHLFIFYYGTIGILMFIILFSASCLKLLIIFAW